MVKYDYLMDRRFGTFLFSLFEWIHKNTLFFYQINSKQKTKSKKQKVKSKEKWVNGYNMIKNLMK